MKQGQWVTNNMSRLVKQEKAKLRQMPAPTIPEQEQVRRFMAGEERWRLDAGLITPTQWAEYESTMLQKLGV